MEALVRLGLIWAVVISFGNLWSAAVAAAAVTELRESLASERKELIESSLPWPSHGSDGRGLGFLFMTPRVPLAPKIWTAWFEEEGGEVATPYIHHSFFLNASAAVRPYLSATLGDHLVRSPAPCRPEDPTPCLLRLLETFRKDQNMNYAFVLDEFSVPLKSKAFMLKAVLADRRLRLNFYSLAFTKDFPFLPKYHHTFGLPAPTIDILLLHNTSWTPAWYMQDTQPTQWRMLRPLWDLYGQAAFRDIHPNSLHNSTCAFCQPTPSCALPNSLLPGTESPPPYFKTLPAACLQRLIDHPDSLFLNGVTDNTLVTFEDHQKPIPLYRFLHATLNLTSSLLPDDLSPPPQPDFNVPKRVNSYRQMLFKLNLPSDQLLPLTQLESIVKNAESGLRW